VLRIVVQLGRKADHSVICLVTAASQTADAGWKKTKFI
jgi:hypothetical protein